MIKRRPVPQEEYNIKMIESFETYVPIEFQHITNLYWHPNPMIQNMMVNYCKENSFKNILEIGPGKKPFPLATKFIGFNESVDNYDNIDIDKDAIPCEDNFFDFAYARHLLEDIQSPDKAFESIMKVSKYGYFETPSPLVELSRGIDYEGESEFFLGFKHHRYIVCSDLENNTIFFLPKYGFLENILNFGEDIRSKINEILNNYPIYWNTYFFWDKANPPKVIMLKNGVNLNPDTLFQEYANLIGLFLSLSIKSTNYFINNYSKYLKYL